MLNSIYLVIALFMCSFCARAASGILVATPDLPQEIYKEILSLHPEFESPIAWEIRNYEMQGVRFEVFQLADQCLTKGHCKNLQKDIESIRRVRLLSPKERQLLSELWIKSGRPTNCYWLPNERCHPRKLDIENLGLKRDELSVIFVDGLIFRNGDEIRLVPGIKYSWKVISSRHQAKTAWGTIDEIENQVSLKSPYATGGCLASASEPGLDITLKANVYVAFDQTCIKRPDQISLPNEEKVGESWIGQNKKWLIPTLAIFAGSAYYLRDKEIEVSNPFR